MTPDRKDAPCTVHPGPTLARAGQHRGLLDQPSRLLIDYEQGVEYWMFQVRCIGLLPFHHVVLVETFACKDVRPAYITADSRDRSCFSYLYSPGIGEIHIVRRELGLIFRIGTRMQLFSWNWLVSVVSFILWKTFFSA